MKIILICSIWRVMEMHLMVALASLALQSDKKLFQKSNLENKTVILTLSGADIRTLNWYWSLKVLGTLPIFFQDIFLDNET